MSSDGENNNNVTPLHAVADKRRRARDAFRSMSEGYAKEARHVDHTGTVAGCVAGDWEALAGEDGSPPGCPVTGLGYKDDIFYFLTARQTISTIDRSRKGRDHLFTLVTPCEHYLEWAWPKMSRGKMPAPTGEFHYEHAYKRLLRMATFRGPIDIDNVVRGRGAWKGEDGRLVLHLGSYLWVDGERHDTGFDGAHVYPRRPGLLEPDDAFEDPAHELLNMFAAWNFARSWDREILLGAVTAATVGGALERRPNTYITGDKGCGKSTLLEVIRYVLGPGCLHSSNGTEAWVAQKCGMDSVPVILDESEGKNNPKRAQAMLELARVAYDGAIRGRGGADHTGVDFLIRSAFFFASINPPAMMPEDKSRMAMLELKPLPADATEPKLSEPDLKAVGQALLARVVAWWPRVGELLDMVRRALKAEGHDARAATTWGTLVAFSHIAQHDADMTEEQAAAWARRLSPRDLQEFEAIDSDWVECKNTLLMAQPRALEKESLKSVGEVLDRYLYPPADQSMRITLEDANRSLVKVGMKLVRPRGTVVIEPEGVEVFVANSHDVLFQIFDGMSFAGLKGVEGGWNGAMRKMPGGLIRRGKARIGAANPRGSFYSIVELAGTSGDED